MVVVENCGEPYIIFGRVVGFVFGMILVYTVYRNNSEIFGADLDEIIGPRSDQINLKIVSLFS